ncbi:MAG TPA: alpha/beta hydrolase [Candidatus Limnocylindrales bacterium]|nr:alpha/beta hydrolase [Candidatus Limnocylindrales bacterium]
MVLNYEDHGSGPVIVFIHGMAGSLRYWSPFMSYVATGHRTIAIDLLGFGHSPMPTDVVYDYQTHIGSILETLDHVGIKEPVLLIGHSMGGLIALRLAALHPARVKGLVLIAMPIYSDELTAHNAITGTSRLKELAYYGFTSKLLCNVWCRFLRPLSGRLAPKYLRHLTYEAARDSVLHTWQSYAQSLHNVIELQDVLNDIAIVNVPIIMVYGDHDVPADLHPKELLSHHKHLQIQVLQGTHQILNEHSQQIASLILKG